jgi:hypothetical protein
MAGAAFLFAFDRPRSPSSNTRFKVGPDVATAASAALAYEPRLEIGQADIIRPAIGLQGYVMAAMAEDQDPAQAHRAHLAEVIFIGWPSPCVGRMA